MTRKVLIDYMSEQTNVSSVLHLPDDTPKPKAPMMNIRFSPENYAYLRMEASIRGLSVTAFVNWIVNSYKEIPGNVHDNPVYNNPDLW